MISKAIVAACALALTLPVTASAKHGEPGPAPGPTPAPSTCVPLTTDTPSQTINRKASATLRFRLTNCTTASQAVTLKVATTADTLADGTTSTCIGESWTAGAVTLKPRETRSLTPTAPSSPLCGLGPTGALFHFDSTATDASGVELGTVRANVAVTPTF